MCSSDLYIEGRDVINAGLYSSYLKKFAAFNNVAFYDYYPVSGGVRSMKKWSKNGLSAKDMCHLSGAGYKIKGQLLVNAILNSYLLFLNDEKGNVLLKDGD